LEEEEVSEREVWRVGWVFKHSDVLLSKTASQTMRCGLARCPGAKSTRFSIIPVVSYSHVHAISSRLQCNTAISCDGDLLNELLETDVPLDDAIVVSAGKLWELWDSRSELRSCVCVKDDWKGYF
jgi:hypothetical protein